MFCSEIMAVCYHTSVVYCFLVLTVTCGRSIRPGCSRWIAQSQPALVIIQTQYLSNNALEDPVRVELLANYLKSCEMILVEVLS